MLFTSLMATLMLNLNYNQNWLRWVIDEKNENQKNISGGKLRWAQEKKESQD